jgi:hypothetical protein
MNEVMDVFVVTCLSSLELTIEHRARDPIPALDAQNFCGHRPRSPFFTASGAAFPNGSTHFPGSTFRRCGGSKIQAQS